MISAAYVGVPEHRADSPEHQSAFSAHPAYTNFIHAEGKSNPDTARANASANRRKTARRHLFGGLGKLCPASPQRGGHDLAQELDEVHMPGAVELIRIAATKHQIQAASCGHMQLRWSLCQYRLRRAG